MSQLMLAIDTSQGTSVAVLAQGVVLAQRDQIDVMRHAEAIGSLIQEVIAESKHSSAEVGSVVCGVGPGPFTGLRIGIAAAKFFAAAVGAELFGVVSLDAIALGKDISKPTLVYTDARRGEVYFATYLGHDSHGLPLRISGPQVAKLEAARAMAASRHRSVIEVNQRVSAGEIGRLATLQIAQGLISRDTSALYLRAPDATPSKGKRVSG